MCVCEHITLMFAVSCPALILSNCDVNYSRSSDNGEYPAGTIVLSSCNFDYSGSGLDFIGPEFQINLEESGSGYDSSGSGYDSSGSGYDSSGSGYDSSGFGYDSSGSGYDSSGSGYDSSGSGYESSGSGSGLKKLKICTKGIWKQYTPLHNPGSEKQM